MNKIYLFLLVFLMFFINEARPQNDSTLWYKKRTVMIPMRDGVKLNTLIFSPVKNTGSLPFILWRTPYGAERHNHPDTLFAPSEFGYLENLAEEGYILVYQDVRGKFQSEGTFQIHQPLIHESQPGAVDESTDTYDAIDWLIKNIPGNNGKAGIVGISYPGWLALAGAVDPHPALKAASEQACMGDLFLGDDFHHNGAFRLSYGLEYTYGTEFQKESSLFSFPQYDLYDWYRNLGSLSNVDDKYFKGKMPTWENFVKHPDYDDFWQKNSPLNYVHSAQVPMLHVGGYFDQEDINGPQQMYKHMEKSDKDHFNYLVLGPWNHGQWGDNTDHLGKINFQSYTTEWFKDLQKNWFDYWLKNPASKAGEGKFKEAWCFQTGSNVWKSYDSWPPKESMIKRLYAGPDNSCSFNMPAIKEGFAGYISDPAKPVPYRSLPIEETYGPGSRWNSWHVEDQRFVYTRPDVVSFTSDSLTDHLTVTGDIIAHLFASTSGTDADWIVKLIDVYPDHDTLNFRMSGYELPVAMEVFRGRYRKSFSHPSPLFPNKPEEFVIDLHEINHVFKTGHRLMIQVQSSWFPIIDRNPQKYVPNIFEARESDFIKAEHRIYYSEQFPTYIELPVMEIK